MRYIYFILFFASLYSQSTYCPTESSINNRSIYNIGDSISFDDQNILFPVCNGDSNYLTGDSFSFADLNGDLNGGDYKITIISMNATW